MFEGNFVKKLIFDPLVLDSKLFDYKKFISGRGVKSGMMINGSNFYGLIGRMKLILKWIKERRADSFC